MKTILTRDEFRQKVFERDNRKCVICSSEAKDAHHIIERRLFEDGGYHIDNGASLCENCHIKAEQTIISCDEIREAAKITTIVLPDEFGYDEIYDKWGNPILPDGRRVRGELFFDESAQKILKSGGVLDLFTPWVKYPKTKHFPWSEGQTKDDRTLSHEEMTRLFSGREVIVTEKIDGENSSAYQDYLHARSIDGRNHPSRNWLKNFHAKIQYHIPDHWRICGENVFAKHSIKYKNLPSYFLAFAIFDDKNNCLKWDDFIEWCKLLDLTPVPVLYRGIFDEEKIKECYTGNSVYEGSDAQEGYVMRLSDVIPFTQYKDSLAKFVRKNHVQTNHNWMNQPIVKNELRR